MNHDPEKKVVQFTLPGVTHAPQSAPAPSKAPTTGQTGDALFKRPLKKKKVLFPRSMRGALPAKPKDPTEIPILHPTGRKERRFVDLIMGYKTGDAALLMSGLSVFIIAPLLAGMLMIASGAGTGFGQKGVSLVGSLFGDFFGEDLLGGLVSRAFGKMVRKDAKPGMPGIDRDATLTAELKRGGLVGETPEGEVQSPWNEALRSAAKGVAGAVNNAGTPTPGEKLASKVSKLPSTFRDEGKTAARTAHMGALSSKDLVKAPPVESNLSRLTAISDFAGGNVSRPGLRGPTPGPGGGSGSNFFGMGGSAPPSSASQEMRPASNSSMSISKAASDVAGSIAHTPDPSGQTVDPMIQKLNDIHEKYEAKLAADKKAIEAAQNAISAAPSTWGLVGPMAALGSAMAGLAAHQSAYMGALRGWNNEVGSHWGGGGHGWGGHGPGGQGWGHGPGGQGWGHGPGGEGMGHGPGAGPGHGVGPGGGGQGTGGAPNAFNASRTTGNMQGFQNAQRQGQRAQQNGQQRDSSLRGQEASRGQPSAPAGGGGK